MPAVDSAVSSFSQSESGSPFDDDGGDLPPGVGPWKLAWRRLRRNKTALFFGFVFILLVVLCLLAPVYSHDIAHTGPDTEAGLTATVKVGGKTKDVVSATGIPIGPTWHAKYFFGADENGRDTAVRLLYGGRNSLEIGAVATLITMVLAVFLGVLAGFYRGWWDAVITRAADVLWAYPAVLLGITLGTVFATGGIGPIKGTFLLAPAIVIGIVYIPYVLKPIRAQVLQMREREFVDAARQQGLSNLQIMLRELMPNVASTVVVFVPLILANAILLEAGLLLPRGRRPGAEPVVGNDARRGNQLDPGSVLERAGSRDHAGVDRDVDQHIRRRRP